MRNSTFDELYENMEQMDFLIADICAKVDDIQANPTDKKHAQKITSLIMAFKALGGVASLCEMALLREVKFSLQNEQGGSHGSK